MLRENFWKAGSSGKHSTAAKRAGVVGTFGIGALANFGVCRKLTVETRPEDSDELLRSVADLNSLRIAEECISFERELSDREVGTTLTVILDMKSRISASQAKTYLRAYVGLLPVPVFFNGDLISQGYIESLLQTGARSFKDIGSMNVKNSLFHVACRVQADMNGQVLVVVDNVLLGGRPVEGTLSLLQGGGQLMGLRSFFGLAPIPVSGGYQFGGSANLSFLQPTAGREALSRESIEQVSGLLSCAEFAASTLLAKTDFADRNAAFLQWVVSKERWEFAGRITIHVLPDNQVRASVPENLGRSAPHRPTGFGGRGDGDSLYGPSNWCRCRHRVVAVRSARR